MSKFPNKTTHELRQYFQQQSLEKLQEINRSYGPHFTNIENSIERITETLETLTEKQNNLLSEQEDLANYYPKAEEEEKEYKNTLEAIMSDSNGAERYLALQALGMSPLHSYHQKSLGLDDEIRRITQEIEQLNSQISLLNTKKSWAITELRILNSIIEEKKKEYTNDSQLVHNM